MGMRQPAHFSPAPAYGIPETVATNEHSGRAGGIFPLLILVVALAAATVWFVALPALQDAPAARSCEVVILESGSPACVPEPARASGKATHKPSGRATH
jgi:hypothetical protein